MGSTQVRRMVLGDDNGARSSAELDRTKAPVRDAMHDDAIGISTSLQYAPAPYASTEKLIALAAEAGRLSGMYAAHMREADAIFRRWTKPSRIGRGPAQVVL